MIIDISGRYDDNIKEDGMKSKSRFGGIFVVECRDPRGRLKWRDTAKNLVVNVGLDHILDVLFKGGTPTNPWYVGLTDGTPTVAAGDTMASHAGWVEVVAYDEATRQEFVEGAIASQSLNNSASKAAFTISSDSTTIGGAFLASNSTRGGSTGTLLCVGAFTGGDKSADDGDTLQVQYTYSAADDGV